jgi:hypothetical protein
MGWLTRNVNEDLDRFVEQLERRGMVEEHMVSQRLDAGEDDESERPRHRRRRLGESPEPDVF